MAIHGDGVGYVSIPTITFTGAFSLSGSFTYSADAGNSFAVYSDINNFVGNVSGVIRGRVSTVFVDGTWSLVEGETVNWTFVRDASGVTTLTVNGVPSTSQTIFGNLVLNQIGTDWTRLITGTVDMSGDSVSSRSYDTDDFVNVTDTVLVDTISSQNGTLTDYVTGGFVPSGSGSIEITSISDYECITQDSNGNATFTVAGTYSGTPTGLVYSIDGGLTYTTFDAAPTGNVFTVDIVVNGQVNIIVAFEDDITTLYQVNYITAAYTMGRPAQSNTSGRGQALQAPTYPLNKPIPIMWKDGTFQPLTDPVNGYDLNSAGSTDARLASYYANAGIHICIGNVAQGGQGYGDWQKGGSLYPRLTDFANAVGGSLSACAGIGGEADILDDQATIEADLNSFINDVKADFGCGYNLTKYPSINNNANSLAAFNAVLASNADALDGGDLSVIDISPATDPLNDGIHLILTDDLNQAAQIQYDAINTSTANLTATGIPDGTYRVVLKEESTGRDLYDGDLEWASSTASVVVDVPKGVKYIGSVHDNLTTHTDGTDLTGATS